jgi:hypothetical protein
MRDQNPAAMAAALDSYAGMTPIRFSGFHIDVVSAIDLTVHGAPTSQCSVGVSYQPAAGKGRFL